MNSHKNARLTRLGRVQLGETDCLHWPGSRSFPGWDQQAARLYMAQPLE
jgi:hypothetical protein